MLLAILIQGYLAVSAPSVGSTLDHPSAEPQFHYMHRKEPVPLRLDPSRIAILAKTAGARPTGLRGLPDAAFATLPIDGWTMVSLTQPADADALERLADGAAAGSFVSPVFLDARGGATLVTPEILVRFRANVTADAAADVLRSTAAGEIVQADFAGLKNAYRVRIASSSGFDVLDAANRLALHPEVEFAEPDLIVTARLLELIPNDQYFYCCWHLHSTGQDIVQGLTLNPPLPPIFVTPGFDIDAPEAWDVTTGDPSIITVVFDQGVQLDHPELNTDASLGRDFTTGVPGGIPGGGPVTSCDNHGTAVAGVIGAMINNEVGGVGVAPNTRVASARVIIATASGGACGPELLQFSWVVNGLEWAQSIGARITNHSYGTGTRSAMFEDKIAETRAAGMLHFGSAGNTGTEEISYPARLDDFFAVGALEPVSGLRWESSSYGDELDATAPGVGVFTTDRTGSDGFPLYIVEDDYLFVQGTSFAAPIAAGAAALVLSVKPSLTPDEVDALLRRSCTDMGEPGWDKYYGHGRINANRAVRWAVCPADLNLDGFADFADYLEFLNLFEAQDPSIDFNQDRQVDFSDYLEFLNLFDAGC